MAVAGTRAPYNARWITWADLKAMTEFPSVQAKTAAQLDLYVDRAHEAVRAYGPFTDKGQPDDFASAMRIALFLTAEGMALANSTRPASAAGLTSETIGKYSYSLAPGGGKSGVAHEVSLVPDEAIRILNYWAVIDPNEVILETTHVFQETTTVSASDAHDLIPTTDDWGKLAAYFATQYGPRTYTTSP